MKENTEIKDLDDIRENIRNNKYNVTISLPRKDKTMKEGYITDENKSVIWNKEQVEQNLQNYENQRYKYLKESYEKYNTLFDDVIIVVEREYHYSKDAIRILLDKAYEEEHSCGQLAVIDKLEELLGVIYDFIKANK